MAEPPKISVIIPSLGRSGRLAPLLQSLLEQARKLAGTEILVVCDGVPVPAALEQLAAPQLRLLSTPERGGPGAARNFGATQAGGDFLAFTEDDVTPAADWLERAAMRLSVEPEADVLEGVTIKPGGRKVHRQAGRHPLYLPTNLFVRRTLFEQIGGYDTAFFDAERRIYFREDTEFGFRLERAGAHVVQDPTIVVEHPEEHGGFLDPIRWARRHEMDALLEARHPDLFRERIEVQHLGPFTVRRPIVRASAAFVVASLMAIGSALAGVTTVAIGLAVLAFFAFLVVWAKWRFDVLRLPVYLTVPYVLVWAYVRGLVRFGRAERAEVGVRG